MTNEPSPRYPEDSALPAKVAARDQLLAARRGRGPAGAASAGVAIRDNALRWEVVRRATTIALYVSVGTEPGTGLLIDDLHASGRRVLLPVLRPDNDLDWAPYEGLASLASAARGLLEPTTERLGVDAIATADVVLVPGLAVSNDGMRLGRGGGSYDRALARVPAGTPIAVVLEDEEVGVDVPVEDHDQPVSHALTPHGVRPLG